MSKEALQERIDLTFEKNPKYNTLYVTSDDNVFTDEDMAKQQAVRLKNDTVKVFTRAEEVPTEEVPAEGIEVVEAEEVKAPSKNKK